MSEPNLHRIRANYGKALRAWHVAWNARAEWHAAAFYPVEEREQSLVYDHVIEERETLRAAEERAYERFVAARDVLSEALKTLGDD